MDYDHFYDHLGLCEDCGDHYVTRPATLCGYCAAQRQIDAGLPPSAANQDINDPANKAALDDFFRDLSNS